LRRVVAPFSPLAITKNARCPEQFTPIPRRDGAIFSDLIPQVERAGVLVAEPDSDPIRANDDGYVGGLRLPLRKSPTVVIPPEINITRPSQRLQSSAVKKRTIPQMVMIA